MHVSMRMQTPYVIMYYQVHSHTNAITMETHNKHDEFRFRKDKKLAAGYTAWKYVKRNFCGRLRVSVARLNTAKIENLLSEQDNY